MIETVEQPDMCLVGYRDLERPDRFSALKSLTIIAALARDITTRVAAVLKRSRHEATSG